MTGDVTFGVKTRLQHHMTSKWLHAENNAAEEISRGLSEKDDKKIGQVNPATLEAKTLGLSLVSEQLFQDAFCLWSVEKSDVENLKFVGSLIPTFHNYLDKLRAGTEIRNKDVSAIISALTQLIKFTTSSPDENPWTREGIPHTRHQSLLYEKKIIDLLIRVLQAPMELRKISPQQLSLAENKPMLSVGQLCYRLLKLIVKENLQTAAAVVRHLSVMQSHLGSELRAGATIVEVVANNQALLVSLSPEHLTVFVDLWQRSGTEPLDPRFNVFLSAMVVADENPIVRNQNIVASRLFQNGAQFLTQMKLVQSKKPEFGEYVETRMASSGLRGVAVDSVCVQLKVVEPLTGMLENRWEKHTSLPWAMTAIPTGGRAEKSVVAALEFHIQSLSLISQLCLGRNKDVITEMRKLLPYDCVFAGLNDEAAPWALRAQYVAVIHRLYVDVDPFEPLELVSVTQMWSEVGARSTTSSLLPQAPQTLLAEHGTNYPTFANHLIEFLVSSLKSCSVLVTDEQDKNLFIRNSIEVLFQLAKYGCFGTIESMNKILEVLIPMLDGRNDKLVVSGSSAKLGITSRTEKSEKNMIVMEIKIEILLFLSFFFELRRLRHMDNALLLFKTEIQAHHRISQTDFSQLQFLPISDESAIVPILLDLATYQHPQLQLFAISVLFRHFHQREELVESLSRVQLLIANETVAAFQKIQTMVRKLREFTLDKQTVDILVHFGDLCVNEATGVTNRSNQDIFRILDVHEDLIRMLKLPIRGQGVSGPEGEKMRADDKAARTQAYVYLGKFCYKYKKNQRAVFKHVEFIFSQLGLGLKTGETVREMFRDNAPLCLRATEMHARIIVTSIIKRGYIPRFLNFLTNIMIVDGRPLRRNQKMVVKVLLERRNEPLFQLFNDHKGREELRVLMRSFNPKGGEDNAIVFLAALLDVYSRCCEGHNYPVEVKIQSVLGCDDVLVMLLDPETVPLLRIAYLRFLLHVYLDTEAPVAGLAENGQLHQFFRGMSEKLLKVSQAANPDFALDADQEKVLSGELSCLSAFVISSKITASAARDSVLGELFTNLSDSLSAFSVAISASRDPGTRNVALQAVRTLRQFSSANLLGLRYAPKDAVTESSKIMAATPIPPPKREALSEELESEAKIVAKLPVFIKALSKRLDAASEFESLVALFEREPQQKILIDTMIASETNFGVTRAGRNTQSRSIDRRGGTSGGSKNTRSVALLATTHFIPFFGLARNDAESEMSATALRVLRQLILSKKDEQEMVAMQNQLSALGIVPRCVLLFSSPIDEIVTAAVHFMIALLEGGNTTVQKAFYNYFMSRRDERLFGDITQKMKSGLLDLKEMKRFLAAKAEKQQAVQAVAGQADAYMPAKALSMAVLPTEGASSAAPEARVASRAKKGRRGQYMQLEDIEEDTAGGVSMDVMSTLSTDTIVSEVEDPTGNQAEEQFLLIKDIVRVLQLLCEGHNSEMQNYLREQADNVQSFNLVSETVEYLLQLERYIGPPTISLCSQLFAAVTEFCQGPCRGNQSAAVRAKICEVSSRILRNPLDDCDPAAVSDLKRMIAVCLLSLLEGNRNPTLISDVVFSFDVAVAIETLEESWARYNELEASEPPAPDSAEPATTTTTATTPEEPDEQESNERENLLQMSLSLYIFVRALADTAEMVGVQMPSIDTLSAIPKINQLAQRVARIEILRDGKLEAVYFPIPESSQFLSEQSKNDLLWNVERDSPTEKIADFFSRANDLMFEIEHHTAMSKHKLFSVLIRHRHNVQSVGFAIVFLINILLVAFFELPSASSEKFDDISQEETQSFSEKEAFSNDAIPGGGGSGTRNSTDTDSEIRPTLATPVYVVIIFLGILHVCCSVFVFAGVCVSSLKVQLRKLRSEWGIDENEKISWMTTIRLLVSTSLTLYLVYLALSIFGVVISPVFFCFHLLELTGRSESLKNVIRAVTLNGRALLLTALLGIVIVYIYSLIGFALFHSDFNTDENYICDTLFHCFATTLNYGVRAGGVGELLSVPGYSDKNVWNRVFFDFSFFIFVIIILLNMIFGIILDTFGQLRDQKSEVENDIQSKCFICSIDNYTFQRHTQKGFEHHIEHEHNIWAYLFFFMHLREKDHTEFTGQETYVHEMIESNKLGFFPVNKAISLEKSETEEDLSDQMAKLSEAVESVAKRLIAIEGRLS
eukprot:TRINITY_DN1851_c0_g1_i3.p1 TRINITY_DN1851_c0_g1~~TRINITY_DN1851_c0_g1_i3.p1  ORF type:complete len:2531 (+),score=660.03 TRINITY_DN1851_c0_g1_i3:1073-7594(+)